MTDDQIQALEALYTAAKGKRGSLVDLKRVPLSINAITLDELVEQGFIRTVGRGHFTVTLQGTDKASQNRQIPPLEG